jgi:hypothetical protein
MGRLLSAVFAVATCVLVSGAAAQEDGPPVPIEKASYHLPAFTNEYVTVLNIYVPPQRSTGYHTHSRDSVSVNVEQATTMNQDFGQPRPAAPQPSQPGRATFTAYSREGPRSHKATNVGNTPFHNVSFIFRSPQPGGFMPLSRAEVSGYVEIMNNERVRGWRLVLKPGGSVAAITQQAPGIRIVLEGGEIVEGVPGQRDRAMSVKLGEFYWQDPVVTRMVRNIGTSNVEFVEFELK